MRPTNYATGIPNARRRYRPDALMYLTVAFLWASVWRFQDLWPIIGKLQIPIGLEIAVGLTLVGSLTGPRNPKWTKSRIYGAPFLLLGLMIAGIPFSLWIGKSITFVTKDFVPSLLLMAAVAQSVREADDLEWFAFAHLIGATIYSTWIYLFVPIGSDGRLGDLAYYDANDFALLVVCTIPFAIYFLRPTVATWKRLFALVALGLFVEMVVKSGSRGGFIAFIALMLYILLAFRAISVRLRVSAVAIAFLVMTVLGSATYWNMMRTILHPKDDYNMKEQSGRKFVWKRGVGYMLSRPLLGVGASAFEQAEGTISAISRQYASENRGLKWSTAHNSFVLVGAELGMGGLIIFVTMIGMSFVHLSWIRENSRSGGTVTARDEAFAQTLMASLIGFCVAGFFVSGSYFSFFYALTGLIVAEDSLGRRRLALCTAPPSNAIPAARAVTPDGPRRLPAGHWMPSA